VTRGSGVAEMPGWRGRSLACPQTCLSGRQAVSYQASGTGTSERHRGDRGAGLPILPSENMDSYIMGEKGG
jgi:hypothetical protein